MALGSFFLAICRSGIDGWPSLGSLWGNWVRFSRRLRRPGVGFVFPGSRGEALGELGSFFLVGRGQAIGELGSFFLRGRGEAIGELGSFFLGECGSRNWVRFFQEPFGRPMSPGIGAILNSLSMSSRSTTLSLVDGRDSREYSISTGQAHSALCA